VSFGGGSGAVVPIEVDFAASSFEPPIEASAGFNLTFGDDDGARGCAPSLGTDEVPLTTVQLEVLDAHGGALATPVTLADGTPLDGSERACPSGILVTEPLAWGGYSLRASALTADGTVCYSTGDAPLLLAPTSISLRVPPVLDADGLPPAGCD
jgi:hypothetical protein